MARTSSNRWIVLLAFATAACSGGTGVGDAGATGSPDAGPSGPVEPIFDPAALSGGAAFFDFPYPSDLRVDADGTPQLDGFPKNTGLVRDVIQELEKEHAGFSPITGVYFRFTGPLDESALPTDPAATKSADSVVLLLDIDASSPERGRRMPAYVRFQRDATSVWPADTLVVRAVPGVPLHPGRRYAAVIRKGLKAADGSAVQPSPAFSGVASAGGAIGDAYSALFDDLNQAGISPADVLVASAFTVRDPVAEMDTARTFIEAQTLPQVRSWQAVAVLSSVRRYEAEVDVYELLGDAPPYTTFGTGRIAFDASGQPVQVTRRTVHVGLTVPTSPMPSGGYPIVLYGHGTGGDDRTHFGAEGLQAAKVGIAMLGFDAALHGLRAPPGVNVESLIVENPVVAREVVRQTVIDEMLMLRMLAANAFDLPAAVTGGAAVTLNPDPVLYMGHSQGAQEGAVLLGVEPTVQSAFLSEGGGGAIISVVERNFQSQPIACIIGSFVGEDCSNIGEDHPLLTLVVQPLMDPADPLGYAHRFVRERPNGWSPASIAMTEGTADMDTPPHAIEALTAAIGLPIVTPVVQQSDGLKLRGGAMVSPPVMNNLTLPGGAQITGGLMQWQGVDHFVIYEVADAQNRYVQFLRTAAAGMPTIVGPS